MNNTTVKHTGIVKWFNARKGYGIVSLENSIEDLVFEAANQTDIAEGNKVSCDVVSNATGSKIVGIINLL